VGTEAFVGWRGHGKTMLAVERARQLATVRGSLILTNIYVSDEPIRRGRPRLRVERIPAGSGRKASSRAGMDVDWLIDRLWSLKEQGEGAVLLLDEAGVLFNSREWQKFPAELGYLMAQGRRLRVDTVYTSQFIDQVDKTLRETTEVAHKVRSWPAPTILGRETGRRPFVMIVSTYRPAQVDQPEKRLGRSYKLYRRARERVYDTDEFVFPLRRLARSSPAGPGGARSEEASSGVEAPHPEDRSAAEDGAAVAEVPRPG
jgi:Zonular occludens toxin (Zot)